EFANATTAAALLFSEACVFADITGTSACNPGFGDGVVDLSDFSCYLNEWVGMTPFADITAAASCVVGTGGDGVDLSDFSCYLAEWSGGCDGDPGTPN
ncbi:MAG: GC-type dockerin domain-anchored protein, partial [Planctomycetota bacterium]